MEFFDSDLSPESLVGFGNCALAAWLIPIVSETPEFWPNAIALPWGGGLGWGVRRRARSRRLFFGLLARRGEGERGPVLDHALKIPLVAREEHRHAIMVLGDRRAIGIL